MALYKDTNKETLSRRDFMYGAGAAFTAFSMVPSHVLGRAGRVPPSETIQVAGIGIGGVGSAVTAAAVYAVQK
jgi:hypothetical protein